MKNFKSVIVSRWLYARVFVTVSHAHPKLIFGGNANSQPLEWHFVFNWVDYSLSPKY